jgi:phosphoribosylformylglycinamidine cyclo-ligase
MDKKEKKATYRKAGVDLEAAKKAVGAFKDRVAETFSNDVLSEVGHFGGMYSLARAGVANQVLVCSTDGVGTKLIVACMAGRHDTVGECLVNHCVNDIMVQGAKPLFFMDYISVGKLRPDHIAEVMSGFLRGCINNGVALLGGETAEMPDLYAEEDYDLAGFIVGLADREHLLTGEKVSAGHVLLGLPSTGLHTNGYSLARKVIFEEGGLSINDPLPGGQGETIGQALLQVHRSYKKPLEALFSENLVDAAAHITGGGLTDNLPRVFPHGLDARIERGSWPVPRIFSYMAEEGGIEEDEMHQVFNMGVGMVLIVAREKLDQAMKVLGEKGENAFIIGKMVGGTHQVKYV